MSAMAIVCSLFRRKAVYSLGGFITVRPKRSSGSSALPPVITAVVVIAGLHFGSEILIPFVLAVLLSFLLTPLVCWA